MTTQEIKQQLQTLVSERAKVTSVPHEANMESDLDYIQATEQFVKGVVVNNLAMQNF